MNRTMKATLIVTVFLTAITPHLALAKAKKKSPEKERAKSTQTTAHYPAKSFDFAANNVTFSNSQLEQHTKLYQGYVKKRNEIEESLKTVDRSNVANITYSPFRALKIAETFAHNGSILHELYFQNLGTGTQPGKQTLELINKNFGSLEKFKEDVIACASCSRGWVVTGYCLDDHSVHNYVLDAHNQTVPVLVVPLLVIDIYEHAYMIDYGIDRAQYLKDMWENINWDVVEQRVEKWLKKLQ
ncbi:MAG: superoxide dismutase [Candidatus Dependentiae bacterium]|nr:superoxide dismutase [Candidatus Dependentiae bacterium]